MSNWKNTESWNRGQTVENNFSSLLIKRDPNFRKSSLQEQYQHIDYFTNFGTIDVKAKKRIARGDGKTQDDFVWLEFKNVGGGTGWLCGKTDIIAFEREKDFILVKRKDLLKMAYAKCDLNKNVNSSKDALYKGYSRKGRNDLISIVKMIDILEIHHKIWIK